MTTRLLILCPGQGSQSPAMFDIARADERAAEFIARHAPAFTEADMFDNRVAQPLIVTATLAIWEALRDRIPQPSLAAGYSIGELAAYAVAGAFTAGQAVELAAARAGLMDQAGAAHPDQAMLAVSALPVQQARALAEQHGAAVAIVTAGDSCIVGGGRTALLEVERAAAARGGRCQLLPVAVASHTPLMAGAVAPFAATLQGAPFGMPLCPVLSGIDASRVDDKARAVEHLSRQLAQTIVWDACMDAAVEAGATVALELGPGASLARMFRSRYPDLACRSVSEFRSIEGIVAWIERQAS
ncbi:acyltransferase domain-containing protein [Massilia solisilvae]|uniref:Acyltransferase domain-containing protein n=1 Tax=Massilia solisilvae TaxID=1811225 RepID=A0ABT2BPI4_9BURK|nr:acyltransferase domain-containing protein [Massilia solisilvae]MCS0609783.1 acyltransferase domain-containing protein [Massilia solisilvae]